MEAAGRGGRSGGAVGNRGALTRPYTPRSPLPRKPKEMIRETMVEPQGAVGTPASRRTAPLLGRAAPHVEERRVGLREIRGPTLPHRVRPVGYAGAAVCLSPSMRCAFSSRAAAAAHILVLSIMCVTTYVSIESVVSIKFGEKVDKSSTALEKWC